LAYYDTCPKCGAHNDPGEKCECQEEPERAVMVLDHYDIMTEKGFVIKNPKTPTGGEEKEAI
jgi:hypothetical protein